MTPHAQLHQNPVEVSTDTHAPAKPSKADRIPALDFTKGALVLIMVLYHWINYFIGIDWPYYRYLRFLTPSFIFVSGFLISNVYLSRYSVVDPRLFKRLLTRGLKLMVVFVVLNVGRAIVITKLSYGGATAYQLDTNTIASIFLSGNVLTTAGKTVAFYILVPISYLLLVAAALLPPYRSFRYTFHTVCAFFLFCILVLNLKGFHSPNLEFLTIGILGVLVGFIPIDKINRVVKHSNALAIAYVCYAIAITILNVPFLLLVVGASLSVAALYLLGLKGEESSRARRHVILLGKYSLLGYIAQIAILQILSAGLRRTDFGRANLGASFVAAFALTMISVEVVDRVRAKSMIVDQLYRTVFA